MKEDIQYISLKFVEDFTGSRYLHANGTEVDPRSLRKTEFYVLPNGTRVPAENVPDPSILGKGTRKLSVRYRIGRTRWRF